MEWYILQPQKFCTRFGSVKNEVPFAIPTAIAYRRSESSSSSFSLSSVKENLHDILPYELSSKQQNIRDNTPFPDTGAGIQEDFDTTFCRYAFRKGVTERLTRPSPSEASVLFGEEAVEVMDNEFFSVYHPIRDFELLDERRVYDMLSAFFRYCFSAGMPERDLKSDASRMSICLLIPNNFSRRMVSLLLEICFTEFSFGGVFLFQESVSSALGMGFPWACVVDVGGAGIDISVIEDGVSMPGASLTLPYGTNNLIQLLASLLTSPPYESDRQGFPISFSSLRRILRSMNAEIGYNSLTAISKSEVVGGPGPGPEAPTFPLRVTLGGNEDFRIPFCISDANLLLFQAYLHPEIFSFPRPPPYSPLHSASPSRLLPCRPYTDAVLDDREVMKVVLPSVRDMPTPSAYAASSSSSSSSSSAASRLVSSPSPISKNESPDHDPILEVFGTRELGKVPLHRAIIGALSLWMASLGSDGGGDPPAHPPSTEGSTCTSRSRTPTPNPNLEDPVTAALRKHSSIPLLIVGDGASKILSSALLHAFNTPTPEERSFEPALPIDVIPVENSSDGSSGSGSGSGDSPSAAVGGTIGSSLPSLPSSSEGRAPMPDSTMGNVRSFVHAAFRGASLIVQTSSASEFVISRAEWTRWGAKIVLEKCPFPWVSE